MLDKKVLEDWYASNFEKSLSGRRIVFDAIAPLLKSLDANLFQTEVLGSSENDVPIYAVKIGKGKKKVLLWSQMHGNESTGTKALFDLFNWIQDPGLLKEELDKIVNECTLWFVPMLNPDGSSAFTRVNANEVDLNRDAVALQAKESKLLRHILETFDPKFCFNLHDQRTIFNVEGTKNPATISFLAPSEEIERKLTQGRKETMSVIVAMNALLSEVIPNHIGRYTDEFYPTATGDNFQKMGHNTILIEAGHYPDDYDRDQVRKFNFFALVQGLSFIATSEDYTVYEPYFDIPNNDKKCYDIIYRNVLSGSGALEDIAFQFDYKVEDDALVLIEEEADRGDLSDFTGHKEYDLKGAVFQKK